ncbi:MAG: cardiolipin synthase [Candidatus Omnitrophica bacterium]|nr:cardiolipin synthase [Candidatus Omnitrophota bacterium]
MISDIRDILLICYYLYLLVTIIYLLLDNRETSATFAWIFVLITFPVIGLIFYLLIGRNRRKSHKYKKYQQQERRCLNLGIETYIHQQEENLKRLSAQDDFVTRRKLFELLYRNSNSLLTTNNAIQLFYTGKDKFEALIADLNNAKQFIHMEYFIWRNDSLTEQVKNVLINKSRQGVEVRILFDIIGSFRFKKAYIKQMRKNGIKIYPYDNPHSFITVHSLNYRNHRKIAIIDGLIAYTGGMNMGQEYIDGGKRFDSWRDTHMRIMGDAVCLLQSIFIASWQNTTNEKVAGIKYFPQAKDVKSYVPAQITTSGPDAEWSSIEQLYFTLITSAQESICIQSPYFIPSESIYKALLSAALSGIKVKLIVTGKPDNLLPYWAAFSFFGALLKAGVRIYHYQTGFMHAKAIIVDNEICSVGTANMDIRSFQLNYEVNMLIYDKTIAQDLSTHFDFDLTGCRELTSEKYYSIKPLKKFRNSLARLFAPIM